MEHNKGDFVAPKIQSDLSRQRRQALARGFFFFFFFKQKTAYEIASCLVGSEMCIRDRHRMARCRTQHLGRRVGPSGGLGGDAGQTRASRAAGAHR